MFHEHPRNLKLQLWLVQGREKVGP